MTKPTGKPANQPPAAEPQTLKLADNYTPDGRVWANYKLKDGTEIKLAYPTIDSLCQVADLDSNLSAVSQLGKMMQILELAPSPKVLPADCFGEVADIIGDFFPNPKSAE